MARKKKSNLLFSSENNDWSFDLLRKVDDACAEIAFKELKLNIYENQLEVIGSDQMLDAYSSIGLPVMYNHWSFGKRFIRDEYSYRKGLSGLAYEIVINSSPCISYLMENNSMTMQTLVIAHAAYGHNHFFKNNYLFKQWTDAEGIIDYLVFARDFITKCEEEHGPKSVEDILDAAHSVMDYGIDRYKRPGKLSKLKERERIKERAEERQKQANLLWSTLPRSESALKAQAGGKEEIFPKEPQENILYFMEKYSPVLKDWEREIVRIVRKLSQYFYPQRQTKLMNEGFASFVHYYIMNRLYEKGQIDEGSYLEFIDSHAGVVNQLPYNHPYYSGYNPYALGIDMFHDIKRMCENPTDEDREYFPDIAGQPWLDVILNAVANFRDESFILQFLSPRVMKKWRMFEVDNREVDPFVTVSGIQNEEHFRKIRETLAGQYSVSNWHPDIQIVNANLKTDRTLELFYNSPNNASLTDEKAEVIGHIERLWGYDVELKDNVR